jgi:hypothetical protein
LDNGLLSSQQLGKQVEQVKLSPEEHMVRFVSMLGTSSFGLRVRIADFDYNDAGLNNYNNFIPVDNVNRPAFED